MFACKKDELNQPDKMRIPLIRFGLILGFILFGLLLSGCSTNPAGQRQEILKAFEADRLAAAPEAGAPTDQPAIEKVFIYVDASASQKGFADPAGGLIHPYNKVVNAVINQSRAGWSGAQIYKFGPRVLDELPITAPVDIHSRSFYNQPQTDLAAVIETFVKSSSAQRALGIIITDAVQSVSKERGTFGRAVRVINQWMQNGNVLGIMMYRSQYNDYPYSEIFGRTLDEPYSGPRPFYLLVLAPSAAEFEKLYKLLEGSKFKPEQALLFPDLRAQAVTCDRRRRPTEKNILEYYTENLEKGTKFFSLKKNTSGQMARFSFWIDLQENNHWRSEPLRGDLVPIEVNVTAKRYHQVIKKWQSLGPPEVEFIMDSTNVDMRKVFISIKLERFQQSLQPGSKEAFEIRMRPRVDGFLLPEWIQEVSTSDDTRRENFKRTYNFDNLVRDIFSSYLAGSQTDLARFYIETMNQ